MPHIAHQVSQEIALSIGRGIGYYIGGVFNARNHDAREGDADVCGPYINGRGMEHPNHMTEKRKESTSNHVLSGQCSKPHTHTHRKDDWIWILTPF